MLKLLNWVKDGEYRIKVLKLLKNKTYLPSELAKELDINRASISRILKALNEKKLVDRLSTKSRTITYLITKKGIELVKLLEKINET